MLRLVANASHRIASIRLVLGIFKDPRIGFFHVHD